MRFHRPISIPTCSPWQLALLTFFLPIYASSAAVAQTPNSELNFSAAAGSAPVTLGQPCSNPYIVAIPANNFSLLDRVQLQVPFAFITDSRLGTYILAGAFTHRLLAESLNAQLRHLGFNARVVYRPVPCQLSRE